MMKLNKNSISNNTGGGGEAVSSGPKVGELLFWSGDRNSIPYEGEYHDLKATKVFLYEEFPELVSLNRDSSEGANALDLVSATPISPYDDISSVNGENLKFYSDQQYYTDISYDGYFEKENYNINTKNPILKIRSSITDVSMNLSFSPYYPVNDNSSNAFYYENAGTPQGSENSISLLKENFNFSICPFEIRNLKNFNGDSKRAFISIIHRPDDYDHFIVKIHELDSYSSDLSNFVGFTNVDDVRRVEANEFENGAKTNISYRIIYKENYFYSINGSGIKKYSYDFTGGTIKELAVSKSFNSLINNSYDKSTGFQEGVDSGDFYQIDFETGNLYINNVLKHQMSYNNDNYLEHGLGTSMLAVHEYNNKFFVMVTIPNSDEFTDSTQAWAIFDGQNWVNIQIPYPSILTYQEGIYGKTMIVDKVDLSTGLIVSHVQDNYGSGAFDKYEEYSLDDSYNYGYEEESIVFIYSLNYGLDFYQDTGIKNYINGDLVYNHMYIGGLISNHNQVGFKPFEKDGSVYNQNCYFDNLSLSKMSIFKENNFQFYVASPFARHKIEWVLDVPLDTSTYKAAGQLSSKVTTFLRTK